MATVEHDQALGASAAHMKEPRRHLSEVLRHLSVGSGPRISMDDLVSAMRDRSFGAFLVVFALPNLIPMPPGATLVLGLPLIFVAWQMMVSREQKVWLPRKIGTYTFDRSSFSNVVTRLLPWLERAERLIRPRHWFLDNRFAERILGAVALFLAILVFLPIPFGNWLPAFALGIIGFAHSERDGISLIVGVVIGALSVLLAGTVVFTAGALLALVF